MNYRRVLLIGELGTDPDAALAALRRVAPEMEELRVIAHAPGPGFHWVAGDTSEAAPLVDRLRHATAGAAPLVDVVLASVLDADAITSLAERTRVDLMVVDRAPAALAVAGQVRKRRSLPILCVGSAPRGQGPIREIVCVALNARERGAVAAFLRDHGGPELHATVLSGPHRLTTDLRAALDIAGTRARVTLRAARRPGRRMDLLVLPRFPGRLLAPGAWPAPILVLPPAPGPTPPRPALDVPDLVLDGTVLRARLLHPAGPGRYGPIPDQQVAIVARGTVAAVAAACSGFAEIPADVEAGAIGVFRVSEQRGADALAAVEMDVRVILPEGPLILFDAGVSDRELRALATRGARNAPALLAVRLRPTRSCRAIRARLAKAGLRALVIDASAVLDEGAAHDVGPELDGVRLARVGARMRGAGGYRVVAIVHRAPNRPQTIGFAVLSADEVPGWRVPRAGGASAPVSPEARLEATTGASLITGGRVEIELDNPTARRWLLEAIATARDRVHFQVYMALDDDVGTLVEGALAEAGSRGVRVRVLVDSLHGLEGSLGAHNPLLERLRGRPGVELRVLRPITGAPSLDDLKRRDHRKLTVVDGAIALLGGRNLSHEYYTGFDEVQLGPESTWRLVPWLDAGARVQGPAVAALDRSFLEAWIEAGGTPFEIQTPGPAGRTSVRVVLHRGLRDASTLEAYLSLIDGARSHVTTVNGFPLALEIQHALLRALERGVRVRSVVGSLTPTHGGKPFGGPWSGARIAATTFVHSRIDAIVGAGGEVYQFTVPPQPGWDPALGAVCPHVHAKLMAVDGRVCTVGSANLDITAGYWESELMLVVEDPAITATVETRIDELLAGSRRFDRDDPAWRQSARRREWMRQWPGVLSV